MALLQVISPPYTAQDESIAGVSAELMELTRFPKSRLGCYYGHLTSAGLPAALMHLRKEQSR